MPISARRQGTVALLSGTVWTVACAAPPALSPSVAAPSPTSTPQVVHADAPPVASAGNADDDPEEANDPTTLKPILAKGEVPSFSKSTVGEHECWQTLALSGEARQDYAALVGQCGKPTGAIEYAKPAIGKLDHVSNKRDTFIILLRAGLCYRFFGVGDATIPDLDILIERNGALLGEDKTHGPVAIIDTDKAWCVDTDSEYRFQVQVGGAGQGRYVFGVWARNP